MGFAMIVDPPRFPVAGDLDGSATMAGLELRLRYSSWLKLILAARQHVWYGYSRPLKDNDEVSGESSGGEKSGKKKKRGTKVHKVLDEKGKSRRKVQAGKKFCVACAKWLPVEQFAAGSGQCGPDRKIIQNLKCSGPGRHTQPPTHKGSTLSNDLLGYCFSWAARWAVQVFSDAASGREDPCYQRKAKKGRPRTTAETKQGQGLC
jgi:hypothetical protein